MMLTKTDNLVVILLAHERVEPQLDETKDNIHTYSNPIRYMRNLERTMFPNHRTR